MTKTVFDPKVSTARPEDRSADDRQRTGSTGSERTDSGDVYVNSGPDAYKGLVAGKGAKADAIAEGYVGEMVDSIEEGPPQRRRDPIQELLDRFVIDEDLPKSDEELWVPNVPDIEVVFKVNGRGNARALVERYWALDKYIGALNRKAKNWLSPNNMHRFNSAELRAIIKYRGKLKKAQVKCRQMLEKARYELRWEIQDESKARELAEE